MCGEDLLNDLIRSMADGAGGAVGTGLVGGAAGRFLGRISGHIGCGSRSAQQEALETILRSIVETPGFSPEAKLEIAARWPVLVRAARNRSKIGEEAMRLLEGRQTPRADEIPDEWIDDFFSKAQSISDDGLQRVWSQVLAGKALEPRRYTKRLLHALFLMEASDAELFQRLTRYCCRRVDLQEHAVQPIVFTRLPEGMGSGSAFTDAELGALERLGLVEIDYGAGYFIEGEPVFQYGDTRITFLARPDGSAHPVGSVRLTREGLDLHGVCQLAAGNVVNIDRIIGFMRHLGTSVVVSKPTGERVYESVAASGID